MNCLLRITGTARMDDAEDTTEVITRGIARELSGEQGGGWSFTYNTSEEDRPDLIVRNVVTVKDGCAVIRRSGAVNAELRVVPGETNLCRYDSSFGTLVFGVTGTGVTIVREEKRIVAELSYELSDSGGPISLQTVRITAEK